jgi:hypothetical protein
MLADLSKMNVRQALHYCSKFGVCEIIKREYPGLDQVRWLLLQPVFEGSTKTPAYQRRRHPFKKKKVSKSNHLSTARIAHQP